MKHNQLLIILALLLISVVAWIGTNVYHNLNKSTIPETTSQEILPINPTFDNQTIDNLKKREEVTPVFELEGLPTPIPSRIPVASPSPKLNSQPASSEGQILL